MPEVIPTSFDPAVPFYQQETTLEGRSYLLTFRFNTRANKWFLDIADESGSPIAEGDTIVANWPLFRKVVDSRLPPGMLLALDRSHDDPAEGFKRLYTAPGLTELGTRVQLVYLTAAEVADL
jgi:hypothetical protein